MWEVVGKTARRLQVVLQTTILAPCLLARSAFFQYSPHSVEADDRLAQATLLLADNVFQYLRISCMGNLGVNSWVEKLPGLDPWI